MQQLTNNFTLDEFVPPQILDRFGDNSIWFIDHRLPLLAQGVRDRFNVGFIINNYLYGGNRVDSGFRMPDSSTGAELSDHKRGISIDMVPTGGILELDVIEDVINNFTYYQALGLTTIEVGTTGWIHLSLRWTGKNILLKIPI